MNATAFIETLFCPSDYILFRPIETWTEAGRKHSKVDYKGDAYQLVGGKDQAGQWQPHPQGITRAVDSQKARAAATKCNVFFGVCPRFGTAGQYDQAWQIRVVRTLWSDVDDCKPPEALERCIKAGLPEPSIVIASGNGAHLYWLLADAYLIDDAGDPPPVLTEWTEHNGSRKPRKYLLNGSPDERLYLDRRQNVPPLAPKAQHAQDILAGIASKIGGDHTTDLSRLLRVPDTWNRKDQRNGREPVPCSIVEFHPDRRYAIQDFAKFAEESPQRAQREVIAKIKLPAPRKLTPKKQDRLQQLLLTCDAAAIGTRSESDFALCCYAIENGIDRAELWQQAHDVGKFKENGERYFDTTWGKAEQHTRECLYLKVRSKGARGGAKPSANGQDHGDGPACWKTEIIVGTDESRVIDEAIDSLSTQENIYQRGGCLVQVVQGTQPPRGIARPKDAPRIANMRPPRLRELLADSAAWLCPGDEETGQEPERIHPPDWAVKGVEARGQWRGIRPLVGVTEVPILRADGTVVQAPGYDPATGILFQPLIEFPPVPDRLTRADAERARDALLEVVEDFPFASKVHCAGWMAGTLTPLARYAFHGPSPMYLVDGNVRGCGKSLLTDATSEIVAGREMARMSQPRDDEEFRKRITAVAMAGEPLILIDNIAGTLGNASLDAALTATSWSDRILGSSEMANAIPLFSTWYATGNNVILAADTSRRVVHVRLESPEERGPSGRS